MDARRLASPPSFAIGYSNKWTPADFTEVVAESGKSHQEWTLQLLNSGTKLQFNSLADVKLQPSCRRISAPLETARNGTSENSKLPTTCISTRALTTPWR
eukprot:631795-Amphidinium_carterae.1